MEVTGLYGFAPQRALRPGMHRHVAAVSDVTDQASVACRERSADVARDRGDSQQVELVSRRQREQQRHGVIDAWVAIEDYRSPLLHGLVRGIQALRLAI